MRRALGKGLSQLIGEQGDSSVSETALSSIVPNQRQPRTIFDDESIEELANSIRSVGILQPLVVRPLAEGKYELIAGERRFRAAQRAGLASVPIVVRSASNQSSLEMALIENLQREDISPMESARAFRKLMDEFGLTQEQVAEKVGKSRVAVANTVRLLKLPTRILSGLEAGRITEGHARALLGLETEAMQLAMYDKVIENNLTVKDVESAGKARTAGPRVARRKKGIVDETDPNWRALQERASEVIGSPVKLEGSERGGRILIEFYSEEDLLRIMDQLGVQL